MAHFYQANGSRMVVVCDNHSWLRNIRSEINCCLGNRPLVVSLTNLAELQIGKRGVEDSSWPEVRKYREFRS